MTEQFGIKPVEIDKLLLPDFTEFLKKLGIGKTTTWAYMTCLRAMLNILSEQG
ncbi:MAG: phage integrase SAM-like domain-containing protein, partial [Candidatus Omnitrophica bacterium]|nr:phage integrase SAM-like domain-containing protein [Candidatus Omnitrophota bacterium]